MFRHDLETIPLTTEVITSPQMTSKKTTTTEPFDHNSEELFEETTKDMGSTVNAMNDG